MVLLDLPIQSERFNKFLECPATFYYGIDINELNNVPPADHIELAAKLSTKRKDGSPCLRTIPEEAIFSVWNAIQYPKAYTDVLGPKYNDHQRTFLPAGLREFIDHTRQWHSAAGHLISRDSTIAARAHTDPGSEHPRIWASSMALNGLKRLHRAVILAAMFLYVAKRKSVEDARKTLPQSRRWRMAATGRGCVKTIDGLISRMERAKKSRCGSILFIFLGWALSELKIAGLIPRFHTASVDGSPPFWIRLAITLRLGPHRDAT
jgi:hypothetical protein